MSAYGYIQIALCIGLAVALAKPLGAYMARVFEGKPTPLDKVLGPIERLMYRLSGVDPKEEMSWQTYASAMLFFNFFGMLALYGLQRLQPWLPLNPEKLGAVSPDSSFNTAMSMTTNTQWQGYGGESTLSYLTQTAGIIVQDFASPATALAVLIALIRGMARRSAATIGNFWADFTRCVLYILLPISTLFAVVYVSQGIVQTNSPYKHVPLVEAVKGADGKEVTEQIIALGPVAAFVSIKQLGSNGGGFFNVNSAHPFENPTPLSNFLEILEILLLPIALCYAFGRMVGDRRQGWAILAAMMVIFLPLLFLCCWSEQTGNPAFAKLGIDDAANAYQSGGNMEGKEVRFGIANSALWASATTAVANGSVNAMHDSFTPLGGLVPLVFMQFSETILGGVGCGLYGMLIYVVIAVFIAGLMVGRTPEYLGKKIEAYEMKMASLIILIPTIYILVGAAVAVAVEAGKKGVANPGAHGFSEILYAFSSAAGNNGSAFGGISANTPFYNTALGLAMFFGRYWMAVPALAIAGSLARKKIVPAGAGTLATHSPLFVAFLVSVVIIVGALTFVPAWALGPIVEHLKMIGM